MIKKDNGGWGDAVVQTPIGELRICPDNGREAEFPGMCVLFRGKDADGWRRIAEVWSSYGYVCVQAWDDIRNDVPDVQISWAPSDVHEAKPREMEVADAVQPLADGSQLWVAAVERERELSPAIILCVFDRGTDKDVRLLTAGWRDAGDGTGCIEVVADDPDGGGEDLYFQPVSTETAGITACGVPDDAEEEEDAPPAHSFADREDEIFKRDYAAVAKLGIGRMLSRAKAVEDGEWAYGFPAVADGKLHIVREAPDGGAFGVLDAVECDPATFQMRACACGWSLWEGDVLGVDLPDGLSVKAKVLWDVSGGCWAVECTPHNEIPSLPKQMSLETFMNDYGEKAVHCGNSAD